MIAAINSLLLPFLAPSQARVLDRRLRPLRRSHGLPMGLADGEHA